MNIQIILRSKNWPKHRIIKKLKKKKTEMGICGNINVIYKTNNLWSKGSCETGSQNWPRDQNRTYNVWNYQPSFLRSQLLTVSITQLSLPNIFVSLYIYRAYMYLWWTHSWLSSLINPLLNYLSFFLFQAIYS